MARRVGLGRFWGRISYRSIIAAAPPTPYYSYGYAPGYSGGYATGDELNSYGYAPAYSYGYAPAYSYGYAPAYSYGGTPVFMRMLRIGDTGGGTTADKSDLAIFRSPFMT